MEGIEHSTTLMRDCQLIQQNNYNQYLVGKTIRINRDNLVASHPPRPLNIVTPTMDFTLETLISTNGSYRYWKWLSHLPCYKSRRPQLPKRHPSLLDSAQRQAHLELLLLRVIIQSNQDIGSCLMTQRILRLNQRWCPMVR